MICGHPVFRELLSLSVLGIGDEVKMMVVKPGQSPTSQDRRRPGVTFTKMPDQPISGMTQGLMNGVIRRICRCSGLLVVTY